MPTRKNKSISQMGLFDAYMPNESMQSSQAGRLHTDLTPVTYKGLYSMHKYWGKKPHNIVRSFIERYTEEGHLVMDPFCGSGVTAIEALLARRKAIAVDLNPMATFITRATLLPVDPVELEMEYHRLRDTVRETINELYLTRCLQCGADAVGTHFLWEGEVIKAIWYHCTACGESKGVKSPDRVDFERLRAIEVQAIPYFYPQTPFYENSRVNAYAGMTVSDLFTKRNLMALSLLLHAIEQTPNSQLREVLKFTFTSCIHQASKMVFVVRHRGKVSGHLRPEREEVGSWVAGYWIPHERFEVNVWRCFENRFRKVVRGKKEVFAQLSKYYSEAETYEDLIQGQNILICTRSATDLSNLPNECIDYIFTDPPHGDRIPYLELSLMWMSWLRMKADFDSEIVVSNAKHREKNIEDYQMRLALAFKEMHRVLKRGRYMSVAFNSWDEEVWHAFLSSCSDLGFEVVDVTPIRYSANSVMQDSRRGGLRSDFVVTFRKQFECKSSFNVIAFLSDLKSQLTVAPSKMILDNKG